MRLIDRWEPRLCPPSTLSPNDDQLINLVERLKGPMGEMYFIVLLPDGKVVVPK
jgi:hypothetical protein